MRLTVKNSVLNMLFCCFPAALI